MQDRIVLKVGQPFSIYFRSLRFSETIVRVCVDGKRIKLPYVLGVLGLDYLAVEPEKDFESVLMRPGQHCIRMIFVQRGMEITEVVELDVTVVEHL